MEIFLPSCTCTFVVPRDLSSEFPSFLPYSSITYLKARGEKSSHLVLEKVAGDDDLLLEILLQLPIKSLLEFKSVSKHWLSVITDPLFCRHLSRGSSCRILLIIAILPRIVPIYKVTIRLRFTPQTRALGGPWPHPLAIDPNTNFQSGVFWNGAVHWINEWGPSMYFHMETERLQEMPIPSVAEGWEYRRDRVLWGVEGTFASDRDM
ncbi:hypothetical protein CRG98_025056 [Punica granatum]|uniref:F-box domain-containing protein n=1 Tax=Punica granatum TaxID=22663 RepID=A0A2I0JE65_PUNGR|nr:hypothetical protein CRG98_025056 [Punica granatum]